MILSVSHPNKTILLKNGSIADIQELFKNSDESISINIKNYLTKESVFHAQCDSNKVNIYAVNKLTSSVQCIPLCDVQQKLIKFQIKCRLQSLLQSYLLYHYFTKYIQ